MPAINLDNVSFSYSSKPVLDRIDLHIGEGERACLIGPNGCGKTTLLRIASGDLAPEMGTARVSGLATELFQVPEAEQFDGSIGEYLDAALHPLRSIATHFYYVADRLEADANLVEMGLEYDQLLAQMTSFDIWTLNARVAQVLAELGLSAFTDSGLNR
ncbi:ABC transporter ATP-binding protein, partial [Actinomyces sp. S6-Spd3]